MNEAEILQAIREATPDRQTCSIEGCERGRIARGYCQAHYLRWKREGDVRPGVPVRMYADLVTCTVEGCERPHYAQKLCSAHYMRKLRTGEVSPDKPIQRRVIR